MLCRLEEAILQEYRKAIFWAFMVLFNPIIDQNGNMVRPNGLTANERYNGNMLVYSSLLLHLHVLRTVNRYVLRTFLRRVQER
jgi:hypothetical protein